MEFPGLPILSLWYAHIAQSWSRHVKDFILQSAPTIPPTRTPVPLHRPKHSEHHYHSLPWFHSSPSFPFAIEQSSKSENTPRTNHPISQHRHVKSINISKGPQPPNLQALASPSPPRRSQLRWDQQQDWSRHPHTAHSRPWAMEEIETVEVFVKSSGYQVSALVLICVDQR